MVGEDAVREVLSGLWKSQGDLFGDIREVRLNQSWKPSARTYSDIVAIGLVNDYRQELEGRLPPRIDLGSIWAEREFDARAWVVEELPAVSLSVSSRLVHKQDLSAFLRASQGPEALVGLTVFDRTSSLKGEIESIVGPLKDHRDRLLSVASRPDTIKAITDGPAEEPVVRVSTGRQGWDYPVSCLGIVVQSADYKRFDVNPSLAHSVLRIAPAERWSIVHRLGRLLVEKGVVNDSLRTGVPGGDSLRQYDAITTVSLRFGNGGSALATSNLLRNLTRYGLFRRAPRFSKNPMRIGVLDAVKTQQVRPFMGEISSQLSSLRVGCTFEDVPFDGGLSRASLEAAVNAYQKARFDAMLAFLPDSQEDNDEDGDDWGPYRHLKGLTIGRGIPSQVVESGTLTKRFAVGNVVLGLLGKTGNIPFALASRLSDVDLVVGLDIARERKTHLTGSMNATAIARIYLSDGEFLRYVIHDAPLEGETIPSGVLQTLFPMRDFENKRIIVHRDGYFRGDEREALYRWGQSIGATFHLIEVIKSGSPRIYGMNGGGAMMPEKGMYMRINDREALLVSTPPPSKEATPRPLHIRTDGSLSLEAGIASVLDLTLLHYGSLRPPKLPVTIHYSDRIAYLALRGIKPKDLEGNTPFWL
jgi:hypothetical protein